MNPTEGLAMKESHPGYSPHPRDFRLENLKNTQFFPEKNSTLGKFQTFVSHWKIPGERIFVFWTLLWCLFTAPALAKPVHESWPVPSTLGQNGWRVNLVDETLLLSSIHSNWVHAYSLAGGLLWRRTLNWPLVEPVERMAGLLLVQFPGQRPWLLQPQSGEVRLALDLPGWVLPLDEKSWLFFSLEGSLYRLTQDWSERQLLGRLSLLRGDRWLGPPVLKEGMLYVSSAQGEFRRVELHPYFKVVPLRAWARPLLAPTAHPKGILSVNLEGQLSLRRGRNQRGLTSWSVRFPGWSQCYSPKGELLSIPTQDLEGNVYLATQNQASSWDDQGKLRWRRTLPNLTPLTWHHGWLYAIDSSPALLQLDPGTGAAVATLPLDAPPSGNPSAWNGHLALVLENARVQTVGLPLGASPQELKN